MNKSNAVVLAPPRFRINYVGMAISRSVAIALKMSGTFYESRLQDGMTAPIFVEMIQI
jgi:hypothetical protein